MISQLSQFETKANGVIGHCQNDILTLRTGRASVQMLDSVKVDAYGTNMKITELASIAISDAYLLVIKPWDKSLLEAIEKAVSSADLNLNPVVDGDMIRIVVPPLTHERRQELVKLLNKKIESYKIMIRSIRADAKKEIEDLKGSQDISEDDIHQYLENLDELTAEKITQLDNLASHKEKELITV